MENGERILGEHEDTARRVDFAKKTLRAWKNWEKGLRLQAVKSCNCWS